MTQTVVRTVRIPFSMALMINGFGVIRESVKGCGTIYHILEFGDFNYDGQTEQVV